MSSGALTQLVARGAQDENFISNDLSNSIFQEKHKKITNFAKSTHSMQPNGNVNWGNTIKFKIEKKGDMLGSMYLVAKLPKLQSSNIENNDNYYFRWSNYVGNLLIENVKLFIGGQLIDEQTGEFKQLYTDLYDDDWNKLCLIGMDETLITPKDDYILPTFIYIPLKFWFCNDLTKALPLIALQYHDVEIEVKLRNLESCYNILSAESTTDEAGVNKSYFMNVKSNDIKFKNTDLEDVRLDCNFIYLDTEERKKVAQSKHKILINQVQKIKCSVSQGKTIELNFNHPVKELFYYFSSNRNENLGETFNFSNKTEYINKDDKEAIENGTTVTINEYLKSAKRHVLGEARILINGHARVDWNDYKYYYYLQNYENYKNKLEHHIYLYSFSGNPKAKTPMGSLNFSRIDNSQLQFTMNSDTKSESKRFLADSTVADDENYNINIYATNYNYLMIRGGMAGLLYSN